MKGIFQNALPCLMLLILLPSPLPCFTNNPPSTAIPSIFDMMADITTQPSIVPLPTTQAPQSPTIPATNQIPQHVLLAFEILKQFAGQSSQSNAATQSPPAASVNQASQLVTTPGSVNTAVASPLSNQSTTDPVNSTNPILPAKFASLADLISQIGEGGEGGGLADMMATFNMLQQRNPNMNGMNQNGMNMNGMNRNSMPQRPGPDVEASEQAVEGQATVRSEGKAPTPQHCPFAEPAPANGNVQSQTGLVLPVDRPSNGFGPSNSQNAPTQGWDSNTAQQWPSYNNGMLNSNNPSTQQQPYPNQMTNNFQQPQSNYPNPGGNSPPNVLSVQGAQNPEIDLRNLQNMNTIGNNNQPFSQNQIYNLQNLANQPETQQQSVQSSSSMLMPGPNPDPNNNIFQPMFGGNNPSSNPSPAQPQFQNQLQQQQTLQQQQQRPETTQNIQNPDINAVGSGPATIKDISQIMTGGTSDVPTYYQTADGKLVRVIPYQAKSDQSKVQPTPVNRISSSMQRQQQNSTRQGTQIRNPVRYVRLPQNNIRMNPFAPRQVRQQSFQRNSQQNQIFPGSQRYPFNQRFMPRQLQLQQVQQQRRLSPSTQGQVQGRGQLQVQGQGETQEPAQQSAPRQPQFFLPRFGMMSPFQSRGDSPIIEKITDGAANPREAQQNTPSQTVSAKQAPSINQIITPGNAVANNPRVTQNGGQSSSQQNAPLKQITSINQIVSARGDNSNALSRRQTTTNNGQQLFRVRNSPSQFLMYQNRAFRPFQGQSRQP